MIRTRLDAPIVLAHGLFGFRRIGLGRLTLKLYFGGIPEAMRGAGNRVVVTRVPSIAGVKRRARVLAEEIERAFPGEPVHIIGHSMGGLDARHLLANPAWVGRILSLTTIGTPHKGSAIADLARLRVGRVYRLLRVFGVEHRGFLDLTRRAAGAVNRGGFSAPGVLCQSVAGDPLAEDVYWTLRPFHEILGDLEGPNDGLVSVESALGFGSPLPNWPVDHFRQMTWHPPSHGPSSRSSIIKRYDDVLDSLVQQGFQATGPPPPPSEHHRRVFFAAGLPARLRGGRPIEEHGDRHVAEDVGGRPTAIEEPVDRQ